MKTNQIRNNAHCTGTALPSDGPAFREDQVIAAGRPRVVDRGDGGRLEEPVDAHHHADPLPHGLRLRALP